MDHPCLKCGTSMVVDQNSPAGYPLDLVCPKCCTSWVIAGGAPELTISEAAATLTISTKLPHLPRPVRCRLLEGRAPRDRRPLSPTRHIRSPYGENVVTWNLRRRRGATAFRRAMSRSVTTVWKPLCLDTGALELESPVAVLGP
jgi:hypothetical protein